MYRRELHASSRRPRPLGPPPPSPPQRAISPEEARLARFKASGQQAVADHLVEILNRQLEKQDRAHVAYPDVHNRDALAHVAEQFRRLRWQVDHSALHITVTRRPGTK